MFTRTARFQAQRSLPVAALALALILAPQSVMDNGSGKQQPNMSQEHGLTSFNKQKPTFGEIPAATDNGSDVAWNN
jgi:hypothetical protein